MSPRVGVVGLGVERSPSPPFHDGERAVQRRAGVERLAAQVAGNILPFLPPEFGVFLERMFQTLGNVEVDPGAGLPFVDWDSGSALQVSGRARTVWEPEAVAARPGAERVAEFVVDAFREQTRAVPARWRLIEPSRLNPPVN